MNQNKISFYFDETFHNRKINENTIQSEEYFDNYICIGLGFTDLKRDIELINKFEKDSKKYLSITEDVELKSSVVKKKQYKYGLSTFNDNSLKFYREFWLLLEKIDIIPFIFVSNKLEYILLQLNINNNDLSQRALIYTIVKAINVYRPYNVISKMLNEDEKFWIELQNFLKQKINENRYNDIKVLENPAFKQALELLDSFNINNIDFNWNYRLVFEKFKCLLKEKGILESDVIIYIDKEGEKNNTYEKCTEAGFENVYEIDSKKSIEIRCSDLLCGFVGKMMRAIYEDTKFSGELYDKKIRLSEEWFNISKEQFELYQIISKVLKNKFSNYWSTCISIYFDLFLEFICIIYYFDGYKDYDDYKKHSVKEHEDYFENFLLGNMKERFYKNFYIN